jgi:hypothetical protein
MKYNTFIEIVGGNCCEYLFLSKAISDDDTRYFINFVYCEDNKLIATDGRRLHIIELGNNIWEFKDKKFYKFLKATTKLVWFAELAEDPGQFPNYKRVMPDTTEYKTINYLSSKREFPQQFAKLIRALPVSMVINLDYIKVFPNSYDWICSFPNDNRAIVFESGNIKAVIMPMERDY